MRCAGGVFSDVADDAGRVQASVRRLNSSCGYRAIFPICAVHHDRKIELSGRASISSMISGL
jgi:hypothetical protein